MRTTARNLLLALLVAMLTISLSAVAAERKPANNGYHSQKVVYHINDAAVANAGLRNVMNHLNAVGDDNIEVAVVTHGGGIDFLLSGWKDDKGNSLDDSIHELANRGVKFKVCSNTLRARNMSADAINMHAEVVPSGVASVGELQAQGYVYLKP